MRRLAKEALTRLVDRRDAEAHIGSFWLLGGAHIRQVLMLRVQIAPILFLNQTRLQSRVAHQVRLEAWLASALLLCKCVNDVEVVWLPMSLTELKASSQTTGR